MASSKSTKNTKSIKNKHKGQGKRKAPGTAAVAAHAIQGHLPVTSKMIADKQQQHDERSSNDPGNNSNAAPNSTTTTTTTKPPLLSSSTGGGKQLSASAVNIRRREDYASMDAASKDRERTRVKRSRAVKMARDALPATAWAALGRRAQGDVADAIADEIRLKYAATTPGPSSRIAAEYAVQKVFTDKIHLFFPKEEKKSNNNNNKNEKDHYSDNGVDAMDVDSDNDDAGEGEDDDDDDAEFVDDWVPSELTRGWQGIAGDGIEPKK
ncbi:hypothetical protein PG994_002518 [Apiospora phragmitis]|uniref:Uncharacterized protein n=1 Tax=Apiospora phragmitis TaxID=2905665 RepID=A0ABR1W844_9PEZI